MTQFRKKPVVIDAWKIDLDADQPSWVSGAFTEEAIGWDPAGDGLWINTLEGHMVGGMGDMLIRGVKSELYACKPDIFEATYEEVTATAPTTFQDRVRAEQADLNDKLTRLQAFFPTPAFEALHPDERSRLRAQAAAMTDYSNVLGARIDNFESLPA